VHAPSVVALRVAVDELYRRISFWQRQLPVGMKKKEESALCTLCVGGGGSWPGQPNSGGYSGHIHGEKKTMESGG
jgi:hypothetical protein